MKFNTKAVHGGQKPDPATGAVMQPIYQTSTFAINKPGAHQEFEYSRSGNPTRQALEKAIASIENGKFGLAFSSGMAAIDAVLRLVKPGDEVVATHDLYGGTYRIFTRVYKDYGIKFNFVNLNDLGELEKQLGSKTKLIWIETPTNPLLKIIDIKRVAEAGHKNGIIIVVDNTFASPYLQQPLKLGADIVMHSATKYLGGHSDVVSGVLTVDDEALAKRLYFIQNSTGAISGPMDSFLVLRGIKTLHLRMQRHCENARKIAEYLEEHPKVAQTFWPGLKSHPNHQTAVKQMRDFGGMLSFSLKNDTQNAAFKVLDAFNLFTLAESLGGVESLCGHPASMSHASVPAEVRQQTGIADSLIRLSVGIEDAEDLIKDLDNALSAI